MSGRRRIGDPECLTKRIPQNPKYQHIKSRLDTGNSLTKYIEKLEEIKRNYRYKKDELFKRLKVTTFAQLVIQVASLSDETLEVSPKEIQKLEDGDTVISETDAEFTAGTNGKGSPTEKPASPALFINNTGAGESYRSTLQSVISGVGELDIDKRLRKKPDANAKDTNAKDKPYPDCPFLLLDVRDRDAYDQCHIVGAHSYPIATLSRTMNPYTNSILEYVSFLKCGCSGVSVFWQRNSMTSALPEHRANSCSQCIQWEFIRNFKGGTMGSSHADGDIPDSPPQLHPLPAPIPTSSPSSHPAPPPPLNVQLPAPPVSPLESVW
uniref:Rhodanese domain-containing protein n=1 Tax=Chelonoidis abingdonii TaxID=106734 RepID=A0A8C0HBH8_CHEAB